MKKKIALLLATAMTISVGLTGCSTNSNNQGSVEKQTNNEVAGTDEKEESGDKIVLTYWSNQRHDMEFVQAQIDEFNATNDKNIEIIYEVMTENYDNNLELSFQSNQSPDIFRARSEIAPYVAKDMIIPIDEFLTDEDFEKYGETLGIQNINVYEGQTYSIPQFGNTFRLVYNKDVFERAGLDPESPPRTMAEAREYAKIITEKLSGEGVYGFAMNLKNAHSAMYRSLDEVARLSGMFYYDFAKGEYNFEEYAKVVQSFADIYADGSCFPGVESLDIDPLRAQFALGNIGMYMSGYWEVSVYDSQFPMEETWAASVVPTLAGEVNGTNAINSAGRSFVISNQCENTEAAWEFVKFMTRDDYMISYHEQGYGLIIVPSVAEKARTSSVPGSEYFSMTDTDKIEPLAPEVAGLAIEGRTFYDVFASVIMGQMDIDDAIEEMNEVYNTALKAAIESGSLTPIIKE